MTTRGRHAEPRPSGHGRRTAATLVVGLAATAFCGAAYAYYRAPGTGTGTATAAASIPGLTMSIATVTGLYPGNSTTATVTLTNPTSRAITVTAVAPGTITAAPSACTPTGNLTVTAPSTGLPTIAAGAQATVQLTVAMVAGAANTCQATTFTIPITVNGKA